MAHHLLPALENVHANFVFLHLLFSNPKQSVHH